jgi:hypothetical protein
MLADCTAAESGAPVDCASESGPAFSSHSSAKSRLAGTPPPQRPLILIDAQPPV